MQAVGAGLDRARAVLARPLRRGARLVLEFGDIYLEVDPAVGGRITSARVKGRELLVEASIHPENYGSTFWTSPQNGPFGWGWPPVAEVDSAPYALRELEDGFELTGPKVDSPDRPAVDQVSVRKRFSADLTHHAVHIDYAIRNLGRETKRLAPWEITRVAPFGLTFYAGDSPPGGAVPLAMTRAHGCYWFQHSGDAPPHGKSFGDGNGWLAHVTPEGALLVKTFRDLALAESAPGEAEIEIYASPQSPPGQAYVEVENQGPFSEIPASGETAWGVTWYLRTLPPTIPAGASEALVEFVRQTLR
jgi:hypothetical protein